MNDKVKIGIVVVCLLIAGIILAVTLGGGGGGGDGAQPEPGSAIGVDIDGDGQPDGEMTFGDRPE